MSGYSTRLMQLDSRTRLRKHKLFAGMTADLVPNIREKWGICRECRSLVFFERFDLAVLAAVVHTIA